MKLVVKPDGAMNRYDRALWLSPIFDLAWGPYVEPVADIPGDFAPNPVRRGSEVPVISEVWRSPGAMQRVSYGKTGQQREMAVCSADTGTYLPPVPDDESGIWRVVYDNGVMKWIPDT